MNGSAPFRRFLDKLKPESEPDLTVIHLEEPRSFAAEYPHVPKPASKLSPELLAAKWACGGLHGEAMPSIAADLLEAGYDSPALRRLAGEMQVACDADVADLVRATFHELGFPQPLSELQGQLLVSRQVAREVIAGQRDAWNASSHLEIAVWRWSSDNTDLEALSALSDEINWDAPYIRPQSAPDDDLLDAFARLAVVSDEQIFACSPHKRSH